MRVIRVSEIARSGDLFKILHTTDLSQVAVMNLGPGQVSGKFGTDHPSADQTLVVLEGGGTLRVESREETLSVGDVAVIPAGAKHQVVGPSKTLNFYGPPAYHPNEQ